MWVGEPAVRPGIPPNNKDMVSHDFHSKRTTGSEKQANEPRRISDIWSERLASGNDDFIVAISLNSQFAQFSILSLLRAVPGTSRRTYPW